MVEEQSPIRNNKAYEEKQQFQLFFLKNEDKRVERAVADEVAFLEILRSLERGESILIAPKDKHGKNVNIELRKGSREKSEEPWYFTHF